MKSQSRNDPFGRERRHPEREEKKKDQGFQGEIRIQPSSNRRWGDLLVIVCVEGARPGGIKNHLQVPRRKFEEM